MANYIINPTDPPFKSGIYYFGEKEGNKVNPIRCNLFTDEELFRISFSVLIMERLFKNLSRSESVKLAYQEFVDEVKKPSGSSPYEVEEVDRRFRAFIFEWKLYTEHWKAYISDLNESVWPDEFIAGYQDLFKTLMDTAFQDSDFVIAHILRNYVSHANEAINNSHVDGKNNKFGIHQVTLERFLQDSIAKTTGRRKNELQDQMNILQTQDVLIDLVTVAEKAMVWLERCEKTLLDYQVAEPQLLQACNILSQARQEIDESGIQSAVWEMWSLQPLYLDHQAVHTFSLRAAINGQEVIHTYFRNRLNWIGYEAIIGYILHLIKVKAKE